MREYKFRAWHPEDKVMVYDLNSLRLFHGVLQTDDYQVMQFTGLQDKDEKDIYEGDILKCKRHDDPEWIGIVKHSKQEIVCYITEFTDSNLNYTPYLVGWYEYEIIGNIYETPELIEDKL